MQRLLLVAGVTSKVYSLNLFHFTVCRRQFVDPFVILINSPADNYK